MLKPEKEYQELYGDIPLAKEERVELLTDMMKKKKRKKKIDIFEEIKKIQSIKWDTLSFTIYLVPRATPRPRINKATQLFYVLGSDVNKKIFKRYLKEHPHEMIYTPMYFNTDIYIPTPKSMSDHEKVIAELGYIRPISKPDFDNVAKTYADMIQGTLIYDDALIIDGHCKKFYSIKPRIEITIKYMTDFDSLFNRRKIEPKMNIVERNEES